MALNVVSSDRLSTNVKTSNLATGLSDKVGQSKNIIINGAMSVAQRGTSSTTAGYGSLDRFQGVSGGGEEACTHSQHALTSSDTGPWAKGFRNSFHLQNGNQTGGAQAGDYAYVAYTVEAQDLANSGWDYTSASSYITLSFWVKCSIAGLQYAYFYCPDGTAQGYSFSLGNLSANTWTKVTAKIPGNSNLTFNNDNGGGMYIYWGPFWGTDYTDSGNTLNTWAAYSSSSRTPDFASTWWTTNDATFELTGVQLEVGDTATEFEHRSYADELRSCQRYCYRFDNGGGATNNHSRFPPGYCSNSTTGIWPMFRPPMRTTQGATLTHNIGNLEVMNNGNSQSSPTLALIGDGSFNNCSWMNVNLQSGRTQHSMLLTRVGSGQTDWYIIISCEL